MKFSVSAKSQTVENSLKAKVNHDTCSITHRAVDGRAGNRLVREPVRPQVEPSVDRIDNPRDDGCHGIGAANRIRRTSAAGRRTRCSAGVQC